MVNPASPRCRSTQTTIMPRDAESRKTCYLQSVLLCVRNKLIWLLVTLTVMRGERKAVMTNNATTRSRKRSPTRINQSHAALHHCGDQVAFQEKGPTYVDSSCRPIQTVGGRYAATARSKPIAMFSAFNPLTKAATTRFGSASHTPTLGRSTITALATLSAASKNEGKARIEAIHMITCDHSRCAGMWSSI